MNRRLFGWRVDQDRQVMREMPAGPNGSLWSHLLESWLVSDGATLHLYDHNNLMRLTYAEEMRQQADALRRQTDALKQRTDALAQQTDALTQRTVPESRRVQVLAEKLRSLGIDPDQV